MKAEELRLGNYVNYLNYDLYEDAVVHDGTYEIEKVTIGILTTISNGNDDLKKGVYEPIPLTDEWLLKLGFEKTEVYQIGRKYDGWLNFSFNLDVNHIKNSFFHHWIGGNVEVKYVHQLQNIYFLLNGRELTLKAS